MQQDMNFEEFVKIKVIPRAKKTEYIWKMDDGSLKIRIKAVPENGRANAELLDFLSTYFWCEWELVSGTTNSRKVVKRRKEK